MSHAYTGRRIGFIVEYRGGFFPFTGIVTPQGFIRGTHSGQSCPTAEIARQAIPDPDSLDHLFAVPVVSDSVYSRTTVDQLEAAELADSGLLAA